MLRSQDSKENQSRFKPTPTHFHLVGAPKRDCCRWVLWSPLSPRCLPRPYSRLQWSDHGSDPFSPNEESVHRDWVRDDWGPQQWAQKGGNTTGRRTDLKHHRARRLLKHHLAFRVFATSGLLMALGSSDAGIFRSSIWVSSHGFRFPLSVQNSAVRNLCSGLGQRLFPCDGARPW